jgi:hypothetical protein
MTTVYLARFWNLDGDQDALGIFHTENGARAACERDYGRPLPFGSLTWTPGYTAESRRAEIANVGTYTVHAWRVEP